MFLVKIFCVLVHFISFCISCNCLIHTNEFAVRIPGPPGFADQVAAKYGFINNGQIGSLEGYYSFKMHAVKKRSIEPSSYHTSLLLNDSMVHWCEQQVIKSRVKRSSVVMEFSDFKDPLYPEQWFLHADYGGYDMNVRPAWKRGYTGKGVVVSILDDGIQGNHPDLASNFDKEASYDINDSDDDPSPKDNDDNKHGTRCAGEVAAAANNEYCGVGVAYNAKIGGVRMLDGSVTDTIEASALSLKPNHIHIYSASWGPEDDGKTVDGPGSLAKIAFEDGIKTGRNGLGSIYVWASGNGGKQSDNCNCDGYTNSIYTISISSASESGFKPWYLEECSSTLATTYSSGTTSTDRNIVTVDVNYAYFDELKREKKPNTSSLCTRRHTGTSASAPIAAGLCALALEANRNLSWRDMQYIIILTSRYLPLIKEDGWITNGANRKVSTKFGYGLMDGDAMVRAAEKWKTLSAQHICSTVRNTTRRTIPKRNGESVEATMYTDGCRNTKNAVKYAEHIQVIVTLDFHPRGNLHIMLVSPKNTTSSLLFPRPHDVVKNPITFSDWPFMSVHFWGEEIAGQWKLIIHNAGKSNAEKPGILANWSITFYGTEDLPGCIKENNCMDVENKEVTHSEHTFPIRGISDSTDVSVEKCKSSNKFLVISEKDFNFCASKCPPGSYGNIKDYVCQKCDKSCYSCYGPSDNNCLTCPSSYFLLNSTCVKYCPDGYFTSLASNFNGTHQCVPCILPCLTCKGASHKCDLCKEGFYSLQSECVQSCPQGTYAFGNSCLTCSKECKRCYGPLSSDCLVCSDGYYLIDNACTSDCPEKHFIDNEERCVPCHRSCDSCSNQSTCLTCSARKYRMNSYGLCEFYACDSNIDDEHNLCYDCDIDSCDACLDSKYCDICQSELPWFKGSCQYSCPVSTYMHLDECKKCLGKCLSCKENPYHCTACQDGFYLHENVCTAFCPIGYYSSRRKICKECHPLCKSCFGPSSDECLSCFSENYLSNNACIDSCPSGFYGIYDPVRECAPCHPTCEECDEYGPFHCTKCTPDKFHVENACIPCPDGTFFNYAEKACKKCHDECGTCYGPLSDQCSSCVAPLRLQKHLHACLPCCQCKVTLDCCICSDELDFCLIHDDNLNNLNLTVCIPEDTSSKNTVAVIIAISVVVFVMFIILLGILQYKSSGLWHHCFKDKKYMPVPQEINAKFNADQEKVCLTQEGTEEEDELFLKA